MEDLKELAAASTHDINKLKESIVEKAGKASEKLDWVHSYLIQVFDNKPEIVLHKAQVKCLISLFIGIG